MAEGKLESSGKSADGSVALPPIREDLRLYPGSPQADGSQKKRFSLFGDDVKFDFDLVFHFDGAAANTDWRDAELLLLECGGTEIVSILARDLHRHRMCFSM